LDHEYVEQRDSGYYVTGSRVSLASIVHEFQEGSAPETIRQNFPALSLEQVYGAIAFYLGHQKEIEHYLQRIAEKWEQIEHDARPSDPDLHRRLHEARQSLIPRQR
jgi:uncharacterized protein (DUF433 family)